MNRQQKEQVVQNLCKSFSKNPALFVIGYKGLTVSDMQGLRKQLREKGGTLKVTKARLMKIAAGESGEAKSLVPYLKDQIGIVFASDESPAVAKVLHDFAKNHAGLQLVVGQLDAQLLDGNSIGRIAMLPSKEVLLAQVCGAINAPISGFVYVLNMQLVRLLSVLKQLDQKK